MKRNAMLILLLAGVAGALIAQAPASGQFFERRVVAGTPAQVVGFEPTTIQFMGAEMSARPVKGAPYSAKAVTETTQVLADGNRIHRTMSATLYRDSEGRTRREQSLGPGFLGPNRAMEMVSIMDPVAGVSYALDPNLRVAHKSVASAGFMMTRSTVAGRAGVFTKEDHEKIGAAGGVKEHHIMIKSRRPAQAGGVWVGRQAAGPMPPDVLMAIPGMPAPFNVPFKNEELGTQVVEGVSATGTRTVMTIAAGEIGNERPIEVASERWYSTELQTVVMTRNSDPRSGETVYKLTNISRAEPPRDLFEVPADYTVREPEKVEIAVQADGK